MSKRLDEKLGHIRTAVQDMEANPLGMVEKEGFVEYTKKFFRLILTYLTGTEFVEKDGKEELSGNKSLPKGTEIVDVYSLLDRFLAARTRGMAALVDQAKGQMLEGKLTKEEFDKTYGSIIASDEDAPKDVRASVESSSSDKKLKVKGKELRQKIVDVMNDATASRADFEQIFRMAEAYRKRRKFWMWMIGGTIVLLAVGGVTTAVLLHNRNANDDECDLDMDEGADFDLDSTPALVTIDDTTEPLAVSFG